MYIIQSQYSLYHPIFTRYMISVDYFIPPGLGCIPGTDTTDSGDVNAQSKFMESVWTPFGYQLQCHILISLGGGGALLLQIHCSLPSEKFGIIYSTSKFVYQTV